jgi:hypothetical protein
MQAHQPAATSACPDQHDERRLVLLVGGNDQALRALAAVVQREWPDARVELLPSTTELIFGLAEQRTSVVLIDAAHADDLPPSLFKLSLTRPLRVHVGLVGGPPGRAASIALAELPGWLRGVARLHAALASE